MKILAIETSTEACSAALLDNNNVISRFEIAPRQHSQLILPMIDELLAEAELKLQQIECLAFGCGPGAFTGVRLATSVIQGIAFSIDRPAVAVSSLTALAQAAYGETKIENCLSAIDARMQEIYWAYYQLDANGLMQYQVEEQVCKPELLKLNSSQVDWIGVGSGFDTYEKVLDAKTLDNRQSKQMRWLSNQFPHASQVAKIAKSEYLAGKAVSASQALPKYVRNQVVKK